jgi:hypothetical protein
MLFLRRRTTGLVECALSEHLRAVRPLGARRGNPAGIGKNRGAYGAPALTVDRLGGSCGTGRVVGADGCHRTRPGRPTSASMTAGPTSDRKEGRAASGGWATAVGAA